MKRPSQLWRLLPWLGRAPLAPIAAALVACRLPARQATRVEPMRTLRFE